MSTPQLVRVYGRTQFSHRQCLCFGAGLAIAHPCRFAADRALCAGRKSGACRCCFARQGRAQDRHCGLCFDRLAGQFGGEHTARLLQELISTPGIEVRFKHAGAPLMHLKSYQIDGRWLRTGAANFSASGLKRQDNDLLVIDNQAAAASFERRFDAMFAQGEAVPSALEQQFP
jgi:hypothetical protein